MSEKKTDFFTLSFTYLRYQERTSQGWWTHGHIRWDTPSSLSPKQPVDFLFRKNISWL